MDGLDRAIAVLKDRAAYSQRLAHRHHPSAITPYTQQVSQRLYTDARRAAEEFYAVQEVARALG